MGRRLTVTCFATVGEGEDFLLLELEATEDAREVFPLLSCSNLDVELALELEAASSDFLFVLSASFCFPFALAPPFPFWE